MRVIPVAGCQVKRGSTNGVRTQLAGAILLAFIVSALLFPRISAAQQPVGLESRLPSAPLHEELLYLPSDAADLVTLEVTLFEPIGPGPFPLAVMNHGATNATAENRGERNRFTTAAYYFLSRGYAVALPMMRGFAGSGGRIASFGCDLAKTARGNARDIEAVIKVLSLRPEIDGTRVVVGGQSFGGWNSMAVGIDAPKGVRGLIGFSPAIRDSTCHDQDANMIRSAAELAAGNTLPSLWFYGDNDSLMPVATWHAVFDSFAHAAAPARLVAFGKFENDSHQLLSFSEAMPVWTGAVDIFLRQIGLQAEILYPDYLPHRLPPPTHWANISDLAAVPFIDEQGRALYQRFLAAPRPRVFLVTPAGGANETSGGYDPLGFALRRCAQMSSQCQVYAANDDVVWTGAAEARAAAGPTRNVQRPVGKQVAALRTASSIP